MSPANKTSPFPFIHTPPPFLSAHASPCFFFTLPDYSVCFAASAHSLFISLYRLLVRMFMKYIHKHSLHSVICCLVTYHSQQRGFPLSLFEPDSGSHCLPRASRFLSKDPVLSMINNCPASIVRRSASRYQKATGNFSKTPIFYINQLQWLRIQTSYLWLAQSQRH